MIDECLYKYENVVVFEEKHLIAEETLMKKFANEKSTSTNLKVCPTKENLESDYGLYERLKGIVYEDKHS